MMNKMYQKKKFKGKHLKGCKYEFKGDVICEDFDYGSNTVTKYKSFETKGNSE